ncbi:MAG TPA: zf-TFIIB domain-containing protein [Gemmatimonadaceae bacterium]|nr:zf-TFIIB domain-containing protein [Gemmatimonadaceae bacterium]
MDHRKTPSPTRAEDEYFVKQDAELIKAQRARLDQERANLERKSHYMKCPKCGGDLAETEFHHIKIDRCRECKGIWFDHGEVEMLEHVDQSQIRSFVRSMFGLKW